MENIQLTTWRNKHDIRIGDLVSVTNRFEPMVYLEDNIITSEVPKIVVQGLKSNQYLSPSISNVKKYVSKHNLRKANLKFGDKIKSLYSYTGPQSPWLMTNTDSNDHVTLKKNETYTFNGFLNYHTDLVYINLQENNSITFHEDFFTVVKPEPLIESKKEYSVFYTIVKQQNTFYPDTNLSTRWIWNNSFVTLPRFLELNTKYKLDVFYFVNINTKEIIISNNTKKELIWNQPCLRVDFTEWINKTQTIKPRKDQATGSTTTSSDFKIKAENLLSEKKNISKIDWFEESLPKKTIDWFE